VSIESFTNKLREQSHREQYNWCMQRIEALTEQRDKVEAERDDALRCFTELEESLRYVRGRPCRSWGV